MKAAEYIFSILTLFLIVLLLCFFRKSSKSRNPKGKESAYAGAWWLCIFAAGFALHLIYYTSILPDKNFASILSTLASSISVTIRMFGFDFNQDVMIMTFFDGSAQGYLYSIALITCFISAGLWTYIILIKTFFRGIINNIKVFCHSHAIPFWRRKNTHYIVVGSSDQAKSFLNNLEKTISKKNITVITGVSEQKGKKVDDNYKSYLDNGYTVIAGRADEYALLSAGIYIKNRKTIVIAMSEEDDENLAVARIVTEYIKEKVKPNKEKNGRIKKLSDKQNILLDSVNVSVYAMYSYIERTEHFAFSEYALGKVHFFNPYEVQARKYLMDYPIISLVPKHWINTEKARIKTAAERQDGKLTPYRISNIIIGFGKTNYQVLKKSICCNQLLGLDYSALVIDSSLNKAEKQFVNESIGLFDTTDENGSIIARGAELLLNTNENRYFESPIEKTNISFANLDVLTVDFYKAIKEEVEKNDFTQISIALGNDKLSTETALELRQKLYEVGLLKTNYLGEQYDRVKIFVKIKEKGILSDNDILNDTDDIASEIIVYGENREVLTENYIIEEKLDIIAKRIANNYWETTTKGIDGTNAARTNIVTKWDTLTEFKRYSNRYAAMTIRTKLKLLGFDLVEGAGETEQCSVEKYRSAYGTVIAEKQRREKSSSDKFIDFLERDGNGNILDNARNNLARLEHQRWNVFHLVNGWTKFEKAKVTDCTRQDEKAKQHACITTFEGLTELREKQAKLALATAESMGKELSQDKALSDADTVCYDFDVMDNLVEILKNSDIAIV